MNIKLLSAAAGMLTVLSATLVFAGPGDGIHPGVSPAPWLTPGASQKKDAPPYALTGEPNAEAKERRHISRDGWKRTIGRIGNRDAREVYSR